MKKFYYIIFKMKKKIVNLVLCSLFAFYLITVNCSEIKGEYKHNFTYYHSSEVNN